MPLALVTGANRGIGLALTKALQRAGTVVVATARDPSKASALAELGVQTLPLDVTDPASVAALGDALQGRSLDLLVNNAAIGTEGPSFEVLDFDDCVRQFTVNCVGALRVTRSVLSHLRRSSSPLVINVTSILGSLALNTSSRWYGYRASKAALNMMTINLAHDLRPMGICCVALHPGWVRTEMGGPDAPLTPDDTARNILKTLSRLTLQDSGSFVGPHGNALPW